MPVLENCIRILHKCLPASLRPDKPLSHIVLIIVVGTALYSNTFHVPFIFDDFICISSNSAIHHYFDSWDGPVPSGSVFDTDIVNSMQLRPVVYFTFAANYWLHGLDVAGYHVVNLLIHIAAGLVLYAFVHALTRTPFFLKHEPRVNSMKYLPLAVALLFVCHPVQTSAVTYTVQRFASLTALLYVASITLYVMGRIAIGTKRIYLVASSVAVAMLAMFSKEVAFTLPVMTFLCEICFFEGALRQRIKYLLPVFLTLPIIPLKTIRLTGYDWWEKGVLHDAINLANLTGIDRWDYLLTQFRVLVTYFRLMIMPINLQLDYDYPLYTSMTDPPVVFSVILHLLILSAGVAVWLKSQRQSTYSLPLRAISFGIFWFYLSISVSSSLIPLDDLIFEYRLYLPSIGFILTVVMFSYIIWKYLAAYWPLNAYHALVLFLLVIFTLSLATYRRNYVWGDSERFWKDNVDKAPGKARPYLSLGAKYLRSRKLPEAVVALEKAVKIGRETNKTSVSAMINLGLAYARLFRYDDALRTFAAAVAFEPEHKDARKYYAEMLGLAGRHEESREQMVIAGKIAETYIVDDNEFRYLMRYGTVPETKTGL